MWKDILGREIKIGDIVSSANYTGNLHLYIITKLTQRSVVYKYIYSNKMHITRVIPPLTISDINKRDFSIQENWYRWTSYPDRRLLILKNITDKDLQL